MKSNKFSLKNLIKIRCQFSSTNNKLDSDIFPESVLNNDISKDMIMEMIEQSKEYDIESKINNFVSKKSLLNSNSNANILSKFNELKDKVLDGLNEAKNRTETSFFGVKINHLYPPFKNVNHFDSSEDLNLQNRSLIISFYDKGNYNTNNVDNLHSFVQSYGEVESINIHYDYQGRFAYSLIVFNSEKKASEFKFKFNLKEIKGLTHFNSNSIEGGKLSSVLDLKENENVDYNNLLIINSHHDYKKELKENRSFLLNNIPKNFSKNDLIDICSKYGNVVDIDFPQESYLLQSQEGLNSKKSKNDQILNSKDLFNYIIYELSNNNLDSNLTSFYFIRKIKELKNNSKDTMEVLNIKLSIYLQQIFENNPKIKSKVSKYFKNELLKLEQSPNNNTNKDDLFYESKLKKSSNKDSNLDKCNNEILNNLDFNNLEYRAFSNIKDHIEGRSVSEIKNILNSNNADKSKRKVMNEIKQIKKNLMSPLMTNTQFLEEQMNKVLFFSSLSENEKIKLDLITE